MLLFGGKIYAYLAMFAVVGAAAFGGYLYVKNITAENKALAQQVGALQSSNVSLQATLDTALENEQRQADLNGQLQVRLSDAESRLTDLRRLLLEHDLTALALEKPGLIERRVNSATQNVFDSFEFITAR